MTHHSDTHILNIVRMRAYLRRHPNTGRIGDLYKKMDVILERMQIEAVNELPVESLDVLMKETCGFASGDLSETYQALLAEEKRSGIRELRRVALLNNTDLDISDFIPGYAHLNLLFFDWSHVLVSFTEMISALKASHFRYHDTADLCAGFFNMTDTVSLPAAYPDMSENLIRDLIRQNLISGDVSAPIIDCVNQVKNGFYTSSGSITHDLHKGQISAEQFVKLKQDAYNLLNEISFSEFDQNLLDLAQVVSRWMGPGKAGFLNKLWTSDPSDKHALIATALTGYHPVQDADAWNTWLQHEITRDQQGAETFLTQVKENQFYYDLGLVLSFREHLDESFDDIWMPVFTSLQEMNLLGKHQDTSPAAGEKANQSMVTSETHDDSMTIDFDDDDPDLRLDFDPDEEDGTLLPETHELTLEGAGADLDIEDLYVSEKSISAEDRLIEDKSAWNKYLKPFLSENLIGVLGAGFLMLAWFTISVWVWNKGQYFKILAVALPMFATSLTLGWISRFFHKNLTRGVSPKAPLLFASLCILTLPFNYLISLSMLRSESTMAALVGLLMAVSYTGSLVVISTWTSPIFAFSPGKHLAEINAYILLPGLFARFMGGIIHPVFADVLMFLAASACTRMLFDQKSQSELSSRFRFSLFGGNCLLIIFIFCAYIGSFPSLSSIALFVQVAAIAITLISRPDKKIKAVILSGSLSITGILIAFSTGSYVLVICLFLAAFPWAFQRKELQGFYPDEVVISLLYLVVPAVIHVSGMNWMLSGLLYVPALCLALFYETRTGSRNIKVISYSLPVFIPLVILSTLIPGNQSTMILLMAFIAALGFGSYGVYRLEKYYLKTTWLIHTILLIFAPFLCLVTRLGRFESVAVLGLSLIIWMGFCIKLKGALVYQYRLSLYFLGSLAASVLFLVTFGYYPEFSYSMVICFALIALNLLFSSKKTLSQMPVYLLILCTGLISLSVVDFLGISMKTGTGSAFAALLIVILVDLLNRFSIWQNEVVTDRLFDRNYPLQTDKFLVYPLEITAWILASLSLIKALMHFTFLYGPHGFTGDGIKVSLTCIILTFVFFRFITRYRFSGSGYLIFIPSLVLYVSLCSLLSLSLLPVFIILSLFCYSAFVRAKHSSGETNPEILNSLKMIKTILSYMVIPSGFLIYAYFFHLPGGLTAYKSVLVVSVILISLFVHISSVRHIHEKLVHVILVHITLLAVLAFLFVDPSYLDQLIRSIRAGARIPESFAVSSISLVLFLAVVYVIPGYILEVYPGRIHRAYSKAFHSWLCVSALIYLILFCQVLVLNLREIHLLHAMAGIVLVHLSNRYYFWFPYVFLKAFFCIATGMIITKHPLGGMLTGALLFYVIEAISVWMDRFPKLRFQSVCLHDKDPYRRTAWVIHVSIFLVLFIHMGLYLLSPKDVPFYLMYAWIPFGVFVYRKLGYGYTGYIALGLFVYANCFSMLTFSGYFYRHGLNHLHLISIAMIVSILFYRMYDLIQSRRGRVQR